MTDKEKLDAIRNMFDNDSTYGLEIHPCPFCGDDRIQIVVETYIQPWNVHGKKASWYHCSCHNCSASRDTGNAQSIKEAVMYWNERGNGE